MEVDLGLVDDQDRIVELRCVAVQQDGPGQQDSLPGGEIHRIEVALPQPGVDLSAGHIHFRLNSFVEQRREHTVELVRVTGCLHDRWFGRELRVFCIEEGTCCPLDDIRD
jgi:hypothetical protein